MCLKQCDRIGRFLKEAQIFVELLTQFEKHSLNKKVFVQIVYKIGLLFILTSDHTGLKLCSINILL